ncbi:hypothetical protein Cyast_1126 [Cyanobacterium stanieri PCC 7202]|uniref:Uncharacterized protein n=1 Tax=Cyanobacterium stanieri (strain ATCC 29140 / PCC 7202) TaxID=292563 RepID=K9YL08_CYASC|nr:hypothetical protein Cyast_1126 [Cyanobacterium stanieri PCC 7202]
MTISVSKFPTNSRHLNWVNGQITVNNSRIWFITLLALGSFSNVVFTCALPLVGFGAIASKTLPKSKAITTISLIWLVNQIIGFTMRDYPLDFSTFAWGIVILLGGLLATIFGLLQFERQSKNFRQYLCAIVLILVIGYIAYQAMIWLGGVVLGGLHGFNVPVLWQVFYINALWTVALTLLHNLFIAQKLKFSPKSTK